MFYAVTTNPLDFETVTRYFGSGPEKSVSEMMQERRTSQVSSHRLTHLAAELEKRVPGAVGEALRRSGLSRGDIGRESHKIDGHKEAGFLDAAVSILEDTTFPTAAGLGFVKNSSILVYIGKYSADLRSGIRNGERYSALVDGAMSYALVTSGDKASLVYDCSDPQLARQNFLREFLLFAGLAALRNVTRYQLRPVEVLFEHSPPRGAAQMELMAGCKIRFNAGATAIVMTPATLDLPVPTYDPSLLRYLRGYADAALKEIAEHPDSLRARVERLVAESLPGRLLQASEVAVELGLGTRTLTRRLAAEGVSYSEIVDDLRKALATTYLARSEAPISEIAFLLDYADQATFTTAFKRWTGTTPRAFRNAA